jgi:hypothetical protein
MGSGLSVICQWDEEIYVDKCARINTYKYTHTHSLRNGVYTALKTRM